MDKNSSCKCLKNIIDKFKRLRNIAIFSVVIIIGLISITLYKESVLTELYRDLNTVCGVALAVIAFIAYIEISKELKESNQEIDIFIEKIDKNGIKKKFKLPITIKRKYFTRAELLGILGGFHSKPHYSIRYTTKKEFFENIKNVQDVKENKITIFVDSSKPTIDKSDDEPITNKEGNDKFDWEPNDSSMTELL
ncbi:hypothetical protein BIU14_07380 [Campylobacter fetus]|uniref:hypothetical protein n=1 Tax=Campylobacter fetus TaxID=196 RepID=UPI00053174D8|nr:hypothetical protein [Campylobacter fetus]HDX6330755.1 hypothetical protein [Campylobacter fetus subsp. venerealis]EAI5944643.1 hypothetical protein [Campylobacter fetus]EAJ0319951.1 hypothetical protein [Campylobacter fetus]EAJ0345734.1 hypothetical protein [Campylobacter fetus]